LGRFFKFDFVMEPPNRIDTVELQPATKLLGIVKAGFPFCGLSINQQFFRPVRLEKSWHTEHIQLNQEGVPCVT